MKFTSVLSLSLAHGFNIVFVSFLGEKIKAFSKSLFRLSVAVATPKIKLFRKALVTCTELYILADFSCSQFEGKD
jgi:hypothetical protein